MDISHQEYLEIINDNGDVIGIAPRTEIHGDPSLIHRAVHILIFNQRGELLLQKRSMSKDLRPGMWDTSVGGHLLPGESPDDGAMREMDEELGIRLCELTFLYTYIHSNDVETEMVTTFRCIYEGKIFPDLDEIDEVRFWGIDEITDNLDKGVFTPNFEDEFLTYTEWITS